MTDFRFNLDEQIFLKNDSTNKTYTLTLNYNSNPQSYDVTREWTVPNKSQLESKTDRFHKFIQAAQKIKELYEERITNGYIEVMRRSGVKKQSLKLEAQPRNIKQPVISDNSISQTSTSGQRVHETIRSRLKTGILDRIPMLNPNIKNSSS